MSRTRVLGARHGTSHAPPASVGRRTLGPPSSSTASTLPTGSSASAARRRRRSSGRRSRACQADEQIVGLDVRPADKQLVALGSTSRLYRIDGASGAATAIGSASFVPAFAGTSLGFDFNPTVDRIRVTSDARQNLRLHPDTGATAAVDGQLAYAAGDAGAGSTPRIVGSAYTNSVAGATTTQLFDLDAAATRSCSRTRRTTARSSPSARLGSTSATTPGSTSPRSTASPTSPRRRARAPRRSCTPSIWPREQRRPSAGSAAARRSAALAAAGTAARGHGRAARDDRECRRAGPGRSPAPHRHPAPRDAARRAAR